MSSNHRNLEPNALDEKYAKLSPKEQVALRRVRQPWDFEREANRKMYLASRWMGPLARIAQFAGLVAVLAAFGSVYAVYSRPAPLALVSFPDGTLRCAQPNFDPELNAPLPRSPSDERLCARLEPPPPLAQNREEALPASASPSVPVETDGASHGAPAGGGQPGGYR